MRTGQVVMALSVVVTAEAVAAQTLAPQVDGPRFEVASVKTSNAETAGGLRLQPGGRLVAIGVPLRGLVALAFGKPGRPLNSAEWSGGPDWMDSSRFDIEAKAAGDAPRTELEAMLRTLLIERFHLLVHYESKPASIAALVLAQKGRASPNLRPVQVDCPDPLAARVAPTPQRPGTTRTFGRVPAEMRPVCAVQWSLEEIVGGGATMSQLADQLAQLTQRLVQDKTGLVGTFDFDATWRAADSVPEIPPTSGANSPTQVLFMAVQEQVSKALETQLGLKLESQNGDVEVLVIDHVERPTED